MFASPVFNVIVQGNLQTALNLNLLSVGGTQTNTQTATNTATVTNEGTIGGGGGGG